MREDIKGYSIVLFDGTCNYCNSKVNFIIKWNKKKNIRYASLQSKAGLYLIEEYKISPLLDTLIFIENNKANIYSTAVLKIAKHLNFPINLSYVFIIIPLFIRDAIYKWIAKNRYILKGKSDACVIHPKEVKQLFIEE